jgi:hypothetical protein
MLNILKSIQALSKAERIRVEERCQVLPNKFYQGLMQSDIGKFSPSKMINLNNSFAFL